MTSPARRTGVSLDGVTYRYGDAVAVENVSLDVRPGELFGLLGPSGCGKTTTLRLVAGFLRPETGRILFDGNDVTGVPPEARNIGMVFQNYALFPHMDVSGNVAFGLAARHMPGEAQRERVREALALVELTGFERRPVGELSGGQQQRVALARALVIEPTLLVLDEPLSNLDAALRIRTGAELRALQRRLGITTIYVTHDQGEALGLCDRLAIMRAGRIEQVGAPEEVFLAPASRAVADFLGRANVLPVDAIESNGEGWTARVGSIRLTGTRPLPGAPVRSLAFRPHAVRVVPEGEQAANLVRATVEDRRFLGAEIELALRVDATTFLARLRPEDPGAGSREGDVLAIVLPPESLHPLADA